MFLNLLIFLTCWGTSFGCECSRDGTGVVCSSEQNVSPTQLIHVCPNNNQVKSIALGYSVYCYSGVLSKFPMLSVFYVAGGEGGSCECYSQFVCAIDISGCECLETTSRYVTLSTLTNSVSSTVQSTTSQSRKNVDSRSDIIIIVILIITLIFSCMIIILLYQFWFKPMRRRLIEQRRQLAISNAALARNFERSGRDAGILEESIEPAEHIREAQVNEIDDVELGSSDSCEVDIHINKTLVEVNGESSAGFDHLAASKIGENSRTPECRGVENPNYKTPDSEEKIQGPITRSRRKLRY